MADRADLIMRNIEEKPVFQYLILAGIVLLAAALRFYKLGEWSFWIDEIYTINRAQVHFADPWRVLQNLPTTLWLPVSVILTNISLHLIGISEWSARLAPALIGTLSIPILFLLIRRTLRVGTALIFVLLLALSPWHLFWSQNARFYTSLMLLSTLAAFFFYLAIENDRPVYFVPFYGVFYFALSERLIAAFLLPGTILYLILLGQFHFERPRGLHIKNIIIFFIPILAVILFETVRFVVSGSSTISFFITDFGDKRVEDPFRLLISIVYNIGFPVFSMGLVTGLYSLRAKDRLGLFIMILALLPILLLLIMNPFMFTKDRYAFGTLPFWLLLCAIAIWELLLRIRGRGKYLALGLLIVLIGDMVGNNLQYYLVNHGGRRDWRAAFQLIEEKSGPEDIIVAWWPEFGRFYFDKEIVPTQDVSPAAVLESGQRHWFLIDSETVWGNIPLRNFLERDAQLIEVLYLRLPADDFNLKIYLYDPAIYSSNK